MLTLIIRIVFCALSVSVGVAYGQNYFDETGFPPWLAGSIGFAIAVTLIAAEQAFRRRFARAVVTVGAGVSAGLVLSYLMLTVLDTVIQSPAIRDNIDIPVVLIITYLVVVTTLHHADRFRIIVPFVEFRSQSIEDGRVVVDVSALADARLATLAQAGLFGHRVLVHARIIDACQTLIASTDEADHQRGQRALATLADLRGMGEPTVQIEYTDLPQATTPAITALELARLEGARLISSDRDLISRARAERLPVVDLAALAEVLSTSVQPGDTISVRIEREGEHKQQGIGFYRDGSMVVVNDGATEVGKEVTVRVKRLHHTAQGRMVFADRQE